jgi:hypothetical protein
VLRKLVAHCCSNIVIAPALMTVRSRKSVQVRNGRFHSTIPNSLAAEIIGENIDVQFPIFSSEITATIQNANVSSCVTSGNILGNSRMIRYDTMFAAQATTQKLQAPRNPSAIIKPSTQTAALTMINQPINNVVSGTI